MCVLCHYNVTAVACFGHCSFCGLFYPIPHSIRKWPPPDFLKNARCLLLCLVQTSWYDMKYLKCRHADPCSKKKKICSQKNERNVPIKELRNSHSDESKILTRGQFQLKKIDHLMEGEISVPSGITPTEWARTEACGFNKSYSIFLRLLLKWGYEKCLLQHRGYCK